MTPDEVISEAKEKAGEWLEMSDNPDRMLSGILAKHIVSLLDYIDYLNRIIKHESLR